MLLCHPRNSSQRRSPQCLRSRSLSRSHTRTRSCSCSLHVWLSRIIATPIERVCCCCCCGSCLRLLLPSLWCYLCTTFVLALFRCERCGFVYVCEPVRVPGLHERARCWRSPLSQVFISYLTIIRQRGAEVYNSRSLQYNGWKLQTTSHHKANKKFKLN